MKQLKLKKGDKVWVRLPIEARIKRINKRYGYTLETSDKTEWCYFDDSNVEKAKKEKE